MRNTDLEQVGAGSGLAFVALSLLSAFVYPQQPATNSPVSTTLSWVHGHRVALQAGMILALFSAAVLLWFVGHLRHVLGRSSSDGQRLGPVVLGGGVALAVVTALTALPTAMLAFMESQPAGIPDPTVVRLLADLNTVLFAVASVMTVVFLASLGIAAVRGAILTAWLGWLCLVVGVANGVAVWIEITFSSYHGKGWNAVGWGAYIGFLVIVVAGSVQLLLQSRRAGAAVGSLSPP